MLSDVDVSRIIEMAWEDRTPFEAIHLNFGVSESDVIKLMQLNLKKSYWFLLQMTNMVILENLLQKP